MSEVTTRDFDWANLVKTAEGKSYYEKPVVYEFNGGERVFRESDPHGVYELELPN